MMASELLDTVRAANEEIPRFTEQVSRSSVKAIAARGAWRRLGALNRRLQQVGAALAARPKLSAAAPEEAHQLLLYRENLKGLRVAVETLQFSLLVEKARLEHLRANMQAACAWAASLREIS